ncbi:dihydrofolate reductase family protein [Streptomyces coeruleorubidus]
MTRIIADISVSLDGFVTGPASGPDNGMGGGATIGSALDAGLVDALALHLAPVVLGAGTPLFTGGPPRTLAHRSVIPTSTATHLTSYLFR